MNTDNREIIIQSLECYIEQIKQSCNTLTGSDKDELRQHQFEVEKLLKSYTDV